MLPSSSGSCAASSQRQAADADGGAQSGAHRSARRALLRALYAAVLCAALLPPARAAEDAGARAHREHSRMHHHKRRNGKEVMSGRALTDSGGSTQVWYRKAGEVRQPRLRVRRVPRQQYALSSVVLAMSCFVSKVLAACLKHHTSH